MQEVKIKEYKRDRWRQKINFFLVNYFHLLRIGLLLIILLLSSFLIIKPKYIMIVEDIGQSKLQNQTKYIALQENLEQLNKLNKSYKEIILPNIEKINAIVPDRRNYEDLFSVMELLIKKRGLFLQSVEIDSGKEKEGLQARESAAKKESGGAREEAQSDVVKVGLKIGVVGVDYANLKGLLQDIENNIPILDIVNLSFSPLEKFASFEMNTYYMETEDDK
ncbi:MAG: hypothetical protein V1825_01615 [Candidatus Falkowbacteria bacterium]|nr:hypothetical protein [Candidatus Parcubacteria bacterium]